MGQGLLFFGGKGKVFFSFLHLDRPLFPWGWVEGPHVTDHTGA